MNIEEELWEAFKEWYPTFEISFEAFKKKRGWVEGIDDFDALRRHFVIYTTLDMKNINDRGERIDEGKYKLENYSLEEVLLEWNELRIKKQLQSMSPRPRGRPRVRRVEPGTQKKGQGSPRNQENDVKWTHLRWNYGVIKDDLIRRHEYEVCGNDFRFRKYRFRDEVVTTATVMYEGKRVATTKLVHFLKTGVWVDKMPKEKKNKYRAVVRDGDRTIHLGCFDSEERRLGAILHYKLTHPRVKKDEQVEQIEQSDPEV